MERSDLGGETRPTDNISLRSGAGETDRERITPKRASLSVCCMGVTGSGSFIDTMRAACVEGWAAVDAFEDAVWLVEAADVDTLALFSERASFATLVADVAVPTEEDRGQVAVRVASLWSLSFG